MAGSSADIGIRIVLDDAASAGLGLVDSKLSMIGRDALQASKAFGDMGKAVSTGLFLGFAAAFVAFAAAIVLAVDNAIKFQTILIQMGRAGNLTQAQMDALGQSLMDIGGHSIFSIEELGQAFVVLLQRGVSAADIMKYVGQQAVYLAEATGMKAVPAAQLLASTLISFHIPASQAAKTVDLLQFAIEHGIGPSETLAASLTKLGSIAYVLHLSLADIIPAFDVLSRATGSYSLAATNLYYFLNQVKFGTSTYRDEIQKLGISFYDAKGNFIGLNEALALLYKTLQNKTPQEAAAILGSLFNIRSSQGIAILEQGLKGVYDLTQKLADSHNNLGVAMMRAQQAEQSAAGLWQSFRTNLQDVLTLMGGPFLAVIQPLLKHLNDLSIQLRLLMSENPKLGATFLALGLAISGGGLLAALIILAPHLAILIGVMVAVAAAVIGAAAGFQPFVAWIQQTNSAATPLGATFRTIGSAFQTVGTFVHNAISAFHDIFDPINKVVSVAKPLFDTFDRAKSVIPTVVNAVKPLTDAFDRARGVIQPVSDATKSMADTFDRARGIIQSTSSVVNPLVVVFKFLQGIISDVGKYVKEQFTPAWETMKPQLADTWKNVQILGAALKPLLPVLGAIALIILSVLIGAIHGLVAALAFFVTGLTMVVQGVTAFVTGVVQLFMGFFGVLHGLFDRNGTMIQASLLQMWNGIKNIFGGALTAIGGILLGGFGAILGFVAGFIHGVISFFTQLANNLVGHSIIPDMINAIVSWFAQLPGRAIGAIASLLGRAVGFFAGVMSGSIGAVAGGINNMVGMFASLPGRVLGAIGGLAGAMYGAGQRIIQGLINGLWSMWGGVLNAISSIANTIRSHLPFSPVQMGPLVGIENSGLKLMQMLAEGINQGAPLVQSAMNKATGGMVGVPGIARMTTPFNVAGTGAGGLSGGMAPTIINLDGKVIYDNTMNRMRGDLQMNGMGRAFR